EELAEGRVNEANLDQVVAAQAAAVTSPWFRYFLTYEPGDALERVQVPVLAINGEKDLQVPHEQNLSAIGAALERGGNQDFELHALPDLNHLFQHAESGSPSEYGAIEETWAPSAMELMSDWIWKTVRRP
ncbi:MAG: alpha/beta hydrolase family protein, partial [Longimicrobiales bacterium]